MADILIQWHCQEVTFLTWLLYEKLFITQYCCCFLKVKLRDKYNSHNYTQRVLQKFVQKRIFQGEYDSLSSLRVFFSGLKFLTQETSHLPQRGFSLHQLKQKNQAKVLICFSKLSMCNFLLSTALVFCEANAQFANPPEEITKWEERCKLIAAIFLAYKCGRYQTGQFFFL